MRALRRTIASLLLTASLSGVAVSSVWADPGDGWPPRPPVTGPTCYGSNSSYHVWNLFAPMTVYRTDSCKAAVLLARRAAAGSAAQLLAAVAASRYPKAGVPANVVIAAFNLQTSLLQGCVAPGRGVEFTVDNRTGMTIQCRAQ